MNGEGTLEEGIPRLGPALCRHGFLGRAHFGGPGRVVEGCKEREIPREGPGIWSRASGERARRPCRRVPGMARGEEKIGILGIGFPENEEECWEVSGGWGVEGLGTDQPLLLPGSKALEAEMDPQRRVPHPRPRSGSRPRPSARSRSRSHPRPSGGCRRTRG